MFEPVIKWTGSKRSQAEKICSYIPQTIDIYYEPFCGGASVMWRLLHTNMGVQRFVSSDVNKGLIDLWNTVMFEPVELAKHYRALWTELTKDEDIDRRREYYESVRDRYNKEHDPKDFMFIMRTTTNGMPRYNKDGDFNNSFHLTRSGIHPDTLEESIHFWSGVLRFRDVEFRHCSYEEIQPTSQDFVYFDPPYANTKGIYYGTIDYERFWEYLRGLPCPYLLSFDGRAGDDDKTWKVPEDVYTEHVYLDSGKSSFRKLKTGEGVEVQESLYIRK